MEEAKKKNRQFESRGKALPQKPFQEKRRRTATGGSSEYGFKRIPSESKL